MAFRSPKPGAVTYEDLLALPEYVVGEIVDGELYASPRPSLPHASVASILSGDLVPPFYRGRGGPGGWIILFEPELHLGRDVVVPDLAGWRRARLPEVPDAPFLTLAPDWICEVLSPSTARLDRLKKMHSYAEHEVEFAWLLDPAARTLEIFRRRETQWLLTAVRGGGNAVRAEPFEAIELDLAGLFEPDRAPLPR